MPLDTHESGGRENVQVFPAAFTDAVTSTPFLTFPYGSFFDILVFSLGRLSNNMMTQKCGPCAINRGACLRRMATLVFFKRRTIEVTINLQIIVRCTIAIWGSFCNVTVDPCATCGGSRYHACEKGLIAGCGSGKTHGRLA